MLPRTLFLAGMCFGLIPGQAIAQSAPSDMLIPPALYAVVKAPFTATVEWSSTETQPDGTKVFHRRISRILRDSAGRLRFEDGQDESTPQAGQAPTVRLYDPISRLFASLDSATGVAKISTMGYTSAAALAVPASGFTPAPAIPQTNLPQPRTQPSDGVIREPLPPREIAGLRAEGVRTTTTTPAGKDGTPAAVVVDEVWVSPLWDMQLLHIHNDSKTGSSQAQVTELRRDEPDEALFHPPGGYEKDNWEVDNKFSVVLPKASPLPQPIIDDNLAAATDRVIAAETAHNENLLAPYHDRYQLTMTDYKGQNHQGTMESWLSPMGFRYELHTDTYNEVRVTNYATGQMWQSKDGTPPLRVQEFDLDRVTPTNVMMRLLHSGGTIPKLKQETSAQGQLTCAGTIATAQMCFDPLTGFLVSGTRQSERVEYEGWKKVDNFKYRPTTIRILQNKNVLLEAKLIDAGMEFPSEIFQQLNGLRQIRSDSRDRNAAPYNVQPVHPLRSRGAPPAAARLIHGYAQTHIWVNQFGQVTRAEVQDADDPQVAAVALDVAQHSVYAPWRDNGQPAPFDIDHFEYFSPVIAGAQ
jgi:hypothetical protein